MSHPTEAGAVHLKDARGSVDFGILTIREDEFRAVLDRFPPHELFTGQRQYNLSQVALPGGGSYRVAVVRCIEPGNGEAQSAARDLLEDLKPRWLLVVGIAGGVPSDEFSLGDVIVSTRVHDFTVGAALQDSEPEYALAGGPLEKSAAVLVANLPARAKELGAWNTAESIAAPRPAIRLDDTLLYGDESWRQRVRQSLSRHQGYLHPRFASGATASSDRLIKDADLLQAWLQMTRDLRIVEMESAGVYRATYGRHVPTLFIRGISDIVGLRRDSAWTEYACQTAAAFALALIRTRPVPLSSPPPPAVQAQKLRSLVARWPFPAVSKVDPYELLGVTESELARKYAGPNERPPYVPRDIDRGLDQALSANDRVLIVGHSKSGKSRTAFEAAARLFPQSPLIIPSDGRALVELFQLEPPLQWESTPAIIWLDDLHRFLGPDGLTPRLLNTLSQDKGQLKLLATLTAKQHDEYVRSKSEVHKDTQAILRRFHEVRLSSGLSPGETERAQLAFPQEPREKLAKGLGEHMIAARELVKKFEAAKDTHPHGYVLVHAAIDWRRAGILRPIRESVLQKLAARYVDFLGLPHVDLDPESFSAGLQWARDPIGHHVALLSPKGEDGQEKRFEAFDYLVDFMDRQAPAVSQQAWDTILGLASPSDAFLMGIAASRRGDRAGAKKGFLQGHRHEDPLVAAWGALSLGILYLEEENNLEAERFYRAAIGSQQLPPAALASIDLGALLQARGDLAEAEQLFRAALDSQHPDAVALAMANLGNLFKDRGEVEEAKRFYRMAIDSKQLDAVAFAMNNLGTLFQDQGDPAEAERLFRAAMDSQQPDIAAVAKVNLGKLFEERGDLAEAERLYLAAIDSQRRKATPMAMMNLGKLLHDRGELAEAERLYRAAIDSKAPEAMALASVSLGKLLQDRGELAEAEQLYRAAFDSQEANAQALAKNNLGTLLKNRGELTEAERLFRAAIDSGEPEAAAFAMTNLAPLLRNRGELDEAERLLRLAVRSKSPDAAALAMNHLGQLLHDKGESAEAERLYRAAIASRRPDVSALAMNNLGGLFQGRGELAEAERCYRAAIDRGAPAVAAAASLNLGRILRPQGQVAEAEQLFRAVLESQHAGEAAPVAAHELGGLLFAKGELAEAERLYRMAMDAEDPELRITAMNNLGGPLLIRGELAEAELLYRRVVESQHPAFSPFAALTLAGLLCARGEWVEAEDLYRKLIGSKVIDVSARAAVALARLHLERGQPAEAESLFRTVIASGHAHLSVAAMNDLSAALLMKGEWGEAEDLLRAVMASEQPAAAAAAALNLGSLHRAKGDLTEARRLYREATRSGHAHVAAQAREALAALGDTDTDGDS